MKHILLEKYNIPVPRYTSYPTVPHWQKKTPTENSWTINIKEAFQRNREISLYIHLPFCESMCTFCGCNKRITKNHQVEQPYINALLSEWKMYLKHFERPPIIKELHIGGGTPTFFHPKYIEKLIQGILTDAVLAEDYAFGFEAHPASTTSEHLETLFDLGFRRISIGVQDFDDEILKIINRYQPYEKVYVVTNYAKELGYDSINFDLVFGLPRQSEDHIRKTVDQIRLLKPDRIAFYSYAHVPWTSPGQRAYSEADLPIGQTKRRLYELGRVLLEDQGYCEIGMDHFALKHDALYQAKIKGTLHRNFMGYTPFDTDLMIGLGASAISDSWTAYVQNEKKVETYQERIEAGEFPVLKGHLLNAEDQIIRRQILELICQNSTEVSANLSLQAKTNIYKKLRPFVYDDLIDVIDDQIKVRPHGMPFIRNICTAFDQKIDIAVPQKKIFSQSI